MIEKKSRIAYCGLAGLVLLACSVLLIFFTSARKISQNRSFSKTKTFAASSTLLRDLYTKVPLGFERNDGQTDARVKFIAQGEGYALFLTATGAVFALHRADTPSHRRDRGAEASNSPSSDARMRPSASPSQRTATQVLQVKLVGANPFSQIEGTGRLSGNSNYFIGNDSSRWRTGVPSYAKVRYRDVYPGIDIVYYGIGRRQLEYDFVLAPGADPKAIKLRFEGASGLARDSDGGMIVRLSDGGKMIQRMPTIYQERSGKREKVDGKCVIRGKNTIGFDLAAYDHQRVVFY